VIDGLSWELYRSDNAGVYPVNKDVERVGINIDESNDSVIRLLECARKCSTKVAGVMFEKVDV